MNKQTSEEKSLLKEFENVILELLSQEKQKWTEEIKDKLTCEGGGIDAVAEFVGFKVLKDKENTTKEKTTKNENWEKELKEKIINILAKFASGSDYLPEMTEPEIYELTDKILELFEEEKGKEFEEGYKQGFKDASTKARKDIGEYHVPYVPMF